MRIPDSSTSTSWMRTAAPLVTALLALAAIGIIVLSIPAKAEHWFAKEGPLEVISHGLLVLGAALWFPRTWRPPSASTWPRLALTAFVLLLLAEETDWFGMRPFGPWGNLHNALPAGYDLFALPLVVYAFGPHLPWGWGRALARWLDDAAPTVHESGTFALLAVAQVSLALLDDVWDALLEETIETTLYLVLTVMAICRIQLRQVQTR